MKLKHILMVALGVAIIALLASCEQEHPEPKQEPKAEFIIFRITGLSQDVTKQVHIRAGGYLLDTVIVGNLIHSVEVNQRNMTCLMEVETLTPVLDAISIEGQGSTVRRSGNTPWYYYSINFTFIY